MNTLNPGSWPILSSMFRTQDLQFHPLSGAGGPPGPRSLRGCVILINAGAGGAAERCSGVAHSVYGSQAYWGHLVLDDGFKPHIPIYVVPEVLGLDKVRLVSDDCLLVAEETRTLMTPAVSRLAFYGADTGLAGHALHQLDHGLRGWGETLEARVAFPSATLAWKPMSSI